jgi:hypothetical protein
MTKTAVISASSRNEPQPNEQKSFASFFKKALSNPQAKTH